MIGQHHRELIGEGWGYFDVTELTEPSGQW